MYVTNANQAVDMADFAQFPTETCALPETRLAAGAHLFREGDAVTRIYQVVAGVVSLNRLLEDGRRQIIAFGLPGDLVGFPCDGRHHTDCEALSLVRLQPFRITQIDCATGDPVLRARFMEAALHEIAAMQDHFMMLGRKSAAERVASFLIALDARTGQDRDGQRRVDLPMSRADIADFLGLTTETVSRVLSQLRKSRVIALDGIHRVVFLRPAALRALATGDCD
ncbi:CRP/FNR family transcriptional regulator, anaerobic regulatory protein/CRP/FNR family transcriptional regulator, nitrogen fixation regulation protein [Roseivivax lentus]|uniref:CRP/FNR family transcriptional regulator, anaerobic regulatory protein/CRP/FNR family transcriptional regulator, nitrogen fixation regulation protein n=1 Tax=Roseivivax lentus TaxID=633194 RepID=A0A1N7LPA6_9RHOB|nr:helix-turn-helix domain-containing protein [Roseivivax lentus]SIS75632.1 CRP/FNR family transcriptional regulator, anaerobic regulatory protein/CRP/FNR family transcriptional regulator, nitrogen fixation regulation protein [Roseivivax lentus]